MSLLKLACSIVKVIVILTGRHYIQVYKNSSCFRMFVGLNEELVKTRDASFRLHAGFVFIVIISGVLFSILVNLGFI